MASKKEKFKKYKDKHSNARNTVSGLVNAKTVKLDEGTDTDYVAYEIVEPWLPFNEQMEILEKMNMIVVKHELVDDFDKELLIAKYREHVTNSPYECDGIVISQNAPHMRCTIGNPAYAFAFKNMDDLETVDVIVSEIKWQVSKDGYINPVVIFPPIEIAGVIIKKATGFNAKYIYDNKLGPGAIVTIVRSGGVIPYIKHIVSGANEPQMPDIEYTWNMSEVDIITVKYSREQLIKELVRFFEKLSILGIASSSIDRFVSIGIDTIPKIISVTKEELERVPNFKAKLVNKTFNSINDRIKTLTLSDLMIASNIFGHGLGATMINKIINIHPDILFKYIEMTNDEFINLLMDIDGFAELRAVQFQSNIKPFFDLLDQLSEELQDKLLFNYVDNNVYNTVQDLVGKIFVFTSFRNKDWEKLIENRGGQVTTSVSSKTFMVVATQDAINKKTNAKIKAAIDKNITIISDNDFLSTIN